MSVKIRLTRHGKKNHAFYHIVVADSRAPRDGRFIEVIGSYDPNTDPATIVLNSDSALEWINKGAQPSDTCRRILSYKGVLLRKHLDTGVAKGALTKEQADAKFEAWMADKEAKVAGKTATLAQKKKEAEKAEFESENKVNKAREEILAKKKAEEEAAKAKAEAEKRAAEEAKEKAEAEAAAKAKIAAEEADKAKAEAAEEKPVSPAEATAAKAAEEKKD
ncbi:MAG: 30S ribosomal protein S16 [Bacteroidales bacterium]|jgi:small subunit ribosomal protein S16|nr:30S ribosomal protein S16 [Bacteroidales bacterium]